uniref:Lipoprotein n=1 Tax=Mycoplasma feriruminatoris TaxID=1179777 RepID=A0A654IIQ1_9MOLU|nr:hypothetical protein MF5295_00581 [Mycoplasma feriruminatoris]VZS00421.1 hypothetical protein MF5582_00588 [Mycoplasma feriruminatoris]
MIKLLTLLGLISIVVSTASVVIACTDKIPATSNNNTSFEYPKEMDKKSEEPKMGDGSTGQPKVSEITIEQPRPNNNPIESSLDSGNISAQPSGSSKTNRAIAPESTPGKHLETPKSGQGTSLSNSSPGRTPSSSSNIDNLDLEEHNIGQ